MHLHKRFLGVALAAPLALSACSGDGGTLDLTLLDQDCTGNVNFIPPTADLHVTVDGDGMAEPVVTRLTAAGSDGNSDLKEVPYGSNRVVTVEAIAGGRVVAYGQSAPFDLEESGTEVTVLVQGVNRFTGAADVANNCVEMTTQRAGHTSVRMADGRVLLAGGFTDMDRSGALRNFVATAEIFDPSIGSFVPVKPPCDGSICYDVARGVGVSLKDGRVLLLGGEGERENAIRAVDTAMIFDPATDSWTATEMLSARRGHTAHVFRSGKVLVIGGEDETGQVLDTTEVFDPVANTFSEGPTIPGTEGVNGTGRAFHTSSALNDTTVMLAGGIDVDGAMAPLVLYFQENGGEFRALDKTAGNQAYLFNPVMRAGSGVVNNKFTVVGGYSTYSPTTGRAENSTTKVQWMEPSKTPTELDNVLDMRYDRAAPCVAQIDANRLLVAGGLNTIGVPTDKAEVLAWNAEKKLVERSFVGDSEALSRMSTTRGYGSCTDLGDGRILVTGGIGSGEFEGKATSSAEIYVVRKL